EVYYKRKYKKFDITLGFFKYSGLRAIILHRYSKLLRKSGWKITSTILYRLIRVLCNIDIEPGANIGVGLRLPHTMCIMIGGGVTIGNYCTIMQGVTLGGNNGKKNKDGISQPQLGNNVFCGVGAVIVGPCAIGDNVMVGANAVVTKSIPDNCKVYGEMARIVNV
ncbi:TPA: serine O-acetyltransferase, partial [Vibrio alginolyticus]